MADTLLLVFDADSGLKAMLADVIKKAVGREDCALCELTYGPLGKRPAWKACAARLGVAVEELHRDELPASWGVGPLPCILFRVGDATPSLLVGKAEIEACSKDLAVLEQVIRTALEALYGFLTP